MAAATWALVLASCTPSSDPLQHQLIDCYRFPNREPVTCELMSDGRITVSGPSLADMPFGPDGLSSIIVENRGLYHFSSQGKTAPALNFDNGADYVVEGLTRTLQNGKVGFVNTQLDQVVAPVWDFAFPFEHGVAVVCMGCVSNPVSPGDEHRTMTGGKWGYIDKRGKVVVPVVYDSHSLPAAEIAAKQVNR